MVNCRCGLIFHPSPGPHSTAWDISVPLATCSDVQSLLNSFASFILSRLDYCNVILAGLPDVSIRPLQRIMNTSARVVLGQGPRDSATAALKELHWFPIRARVDYKLCLLAHRALNGTAPRSGLARGQGARPSTPPWTTLEIHANPKSLFGSRGWQRFF